MNSRQVSDLKILVVDDEEFVLKFSNHILKKIACHHITTAGSGIEAIQKIASSMPPYDVVISDLNMPEMDGVEMLRHFSEKDYAGGIILLSGEDERTLEATYELAREHRLNVLGMISKPLKPDILEELLASYEPRQDKGPFKPQAAISVEELREGIYGNELHLFFQPKVEIPAGKVSGVEALARWLHPDRGILSPVAFIPAAEQHGLIDELTRVVYQKAMRQVSDWRAGGVNLMMSVNLNVNSFVQSDFTQFLITTAEKEEVDTSNVTLEITESQVMSDSRKCMEKLMQLRMKRFDLSIDDFGTGNSSLAQLKKVPFTELKIDRAFVYDAVNNATSRAILESSIELGKKLKMNIVAEGVETKEDWDLVSRLGCHYVQGFFVAKPMNGDDLLNFIEEWQGIQ